MRKFTVLFSVFMVFAMLLSACGAAQELDENANFNSNANLNGDADLNDNGDLDVNANLNGNEAVVTETAVMDPYPVATETVVVTTETVEVTPAEVTPMGTEAALPPTGMVDAHLVSSLLDFEVYNLYCEQVGEVEEVVLDMNGQTISYIVVGLGGFLGLGERDVAVPFKALALSGSFGETIDPAPAITPVVTEVAPITGTLPMTGTLPAPVVDDDTIIPCDLGDNAVLINAASETIENAPEINLDEFSDMGLLVDGWDVDFDAYWTGLGIFDVDVDITTPMTGTTPLATVSPMTNTETITGTDPMTGTQNSATTLRGAILASEFIGADVYNQAGEDVADIEDVIINPFSGELMFAVVNMDGPDGERLLPIPLLAFSWDSTNEYFVLTVDAATLEAAPYFEDGQYPDWTFPDWESDFRFYWDPFMPASRY